MQKEIQEKTKSLKILYAMIKSPKMCELYQNAERKHLTAERLKSAAESAVYTLRQYRFDENVDQFVQKIHGTVLG